MTDLRLREDRVRSMAASYSVPANPATFARDGIAAQEFATQIGRPVALKLVADNVVHKSKAGGVLLGIEPGDVAMRTDAMLQEQSSRGIKVRGVTVEAMVESGLETVVGALHTLGFGPVVMFGAGGVDIEILDDVAFALAPLTRTEAELLVRKTRIGRSIVERLPARADEIVDLLMAVGGESGMLLNEPITEVDLNPVVVGKDRVIAVDARATSLEGPAAPCELPDPRTAYDALRPAIYPRSIAVLGASADTQKMGYRVVRNLVDFGFDGDLYPVSRKNDEICGVATVSSIEALPEGIDRAVIVLPAVAVPDALATLAERSTRSAHVYTADTPEMDPTLRETGLRVTGPNCIGHYSPRDKVTMIGTAASSTVVGSIAFLTQSGTYAGDAVRRGNELGLRFSFVSSIGNCDDVSPAEFLAFCEADERTEVIAFYLEDDRGADSFFRLAASMRKPIVLLKGGRTVAGGSAAASHTGALASDPQLLADVAAAAGVLLVDDLDHMLDVLQVLQSSTTVPGDGLGLIGSGGGVAVVGADRADEWGITIPRLGEDALVALERFSAPGTSLSNPIDVPIWSLFSGDDSFTGAIVEATAADEQVDSLCVFLDLGTVFDMLDPVDGESVVRMLSEDILAAPRKDKLLTLVLRSGFSRHEDELVRSLRARAHKVGVPMFDSVDRAIAAIGGARWLTRSGKVGTGPKL